MCILCLVSRALRWDRQQRAIRREERVVSGDVVVALRDVRSNRLTRRSCQLCGALLRRAQTRMLLQSRDAVHVRGVATHSMPFLSPCTWPVAPKYTDHRSRAAADWT